jgi:hypothetical protein
LGPQANLNTYKFLNVTTNQNKQGLHLLIKLIN